MGQKKRLGMERDRAAASFMRYARYGFEARGLVGFALYDAIRGSTASEEEAARMLAVCDTLRLLGFLGREDTVAAVRAVYFAAHGKRLLRNDVSLRVRRFACERYLDDRTVYRRLAEAKRLFFHLLEEGGAGSEKKIKKF